MKVGDLVCITWPARGESKPVGIILGFSFPKGHLFNHYYKNPDCRILWRHGGISTVSKEYLSVVK